MSPHSLSLPFVARGIDGSVNVEVYLNDQPAVVGAADWAQGFPICEASIDWPARGYNALLGWVQVVGTKKANSDLPRKWVTDPLEIYDGLNTPFGVYGIAPTLFDAPARSDRAQALDWHAESYLCFAPSAPMAREVHPVARFSWGFLLENHEITLVEPQILGEAAWGQHVGLLRSTYPGWTFA